MAKLKRIVQGLTEKTTERIAEPKFDTVRARGAKGSKADGHADPDQPDYEERGGPKSNKVPHASRTRNPEAKLKGDPWDIKC